ncbi:MAG: hypothetical protein ACRENI_06815 [Gemmatimonadaceae bacterium]
MPRIHGLVLFAAVGALGALAALSALTANPLAAQDTTAQRGVRIGLTYAAGIKPGVIVLPVRGPGGDSLQAILSRDLDFGDRVTIIGAAGTNTGDALRGLSGNAAAGRGTMNYDLVARLGGAAVVEAVPTPTGLRVALHDVGAKGVLQTADFPLPLDYGSRDWRWAVHGIADEVERWITGVQGIAQTRVLYAHGGRAYVVDSDGASPVAVTDAADGKALSPAWHPSGRFMAFSAMGDRGTQIVVRDLGARTSRRLVATPGGLNITPTFSPDGSALVYAHGEEVGTNLFVADPFGTGGGRQITVGRGSDNVSPSFAPGGERLAFTSGRSGHPEVYIMDADGANAELLTPFAFGDQFYRSNPDWSPDGRSIAFQSLIDGRFQIMTISLRDRTIRQHTSEGANEDPSWAPDGQHVVFTSTRTGAKQLFVLDVESGRVRQLTHAGDARMSAWSPRLGDGRRSGR